jgi:adenylosuccinate lyase
MEIRPEKEVVTLRLSKVMQRARERSARVGEKEFLLASLDEGDNLFCHLLRAKGVDPLEVRKDLDDNWAVIAEAIQTILRREAYPNPYEALKALTRTNQKITQETMSEFIDTLEISEDLKLELKQITPFNYTGIDLI